MIKSYSGLQTSLLFLLFVTGSFVTFGQSKPANAPKFIVVDSATGSPLGKITVYVFNKIENKIISTTITSDSGFCFLKDEWLADTNNIISFNAVNYKEKQVRLSAGLPEFPVKVILVGNPKMLKEVTISSNRKMVNFNGNRMEFDISNVPNVKHMTTSDVLDYLPFMRVDDSKVKMMDNPLVILINGKPHPFFNNAKNLNALPPQAIEQIIVDLVPSSRFGGKVMNIILKKNYFLGWNGNYNVRAGRLGVDQSGQISYWQNKIGIDISANFNTGSGGSERASRLESFTNKSVILQNGKSTSNNIAGFLSASLFYNADSLNSIDLQYSYAPRRTKSREGSDIRFADSLAQEYLQSSLIDRKNEMYNSSFNLNYTRNFKKRGKQLYALSRYATNTVVNSYDLTKNKLKPDSLLLWEQFSEDNVYRETTFEAGFQNQSNKKFRYNTGGKIIHRGNVSDKWIGELADTLTGLFKYNQLIVSGYTDADLNFKKFVLHAGLRFDHEDFSYVVPVQLKRTYNSFFPNLSLTYNLNKYNVVIVSYSRSVLRPSLASLVSFSSADNAYLRDSGSANLKPQYRNNYSFQLYGNYEFGRLGINADYSFVNNFIDVYYVESSNGALARTDFNGSYNRSYQLGISAEIPVSKKIRFSHFSSGAIIEQKGAGLLQKQLSGYISERFFYQINKVQRISISATAYSPNVSLQGKSQGMAYINTNIGYSYFTNLFNKYPLGLSLGLSNPWYPNGTPGYSEVRNDSFYYYTSGKTVNAVVGFQAVITFKGKKFQDKSVRRSESIENNDLKSK